MTAHKRNGWLSVPFALALLLLLPVGAVAQQRPMTASGPATMPIDAALQMTRLPEVIVAAGPTDAAEDAALARALAAYERRERSEDLAPLEVFVAQYPGSGWAAAVHTNIGLLRLHYGYFTHAIDQLQKAWKVGRDAGGPEARALVDRAVGELALLQASLGRMDELAALFDEIGPRAVTGSATEKVQAAREMLGLVDKKDHHLFTCGPLALQALLLARGAPADQVGFLQWQRAGRDGTSLAQLAALADKAKLGYRLIHRRAGQEAPVPSLMHLKIGHFAAVVGQADGLFHVDDAAIAGRELWMRQQAFDSETSGYFLIPDDLPLAKGWRVVELAEAAEVWGRGNTSATQPGALGDRLADDKKCPTPMCGYNIKESTVSLTLSDVPVGYDPAIGPSTRVTISYNQREDGQPANFNFYNVGQKWTLSWLSYVTDDPVNAGANVSRFLSGGGFAAYSGYVAATGRFANQADDGSVLTRTSGSPIAYQRLLQDGTREVYTLSDGATAFPRRVFLTQIIDPQGNALTLNYDGQRRLTSVTDAVGRQTTLTYGIAVRPLLVTQVTDPFGRSASLTYNPDGRLSSITDILGLTSSFTYDANGLVNSMTTPYGTTTFAYTAPGTAAPPRFVQATDPMGFSEREEWLEPAPVPSSDPAATVPTGMPATLTNNYLQYRNSFHWDKNAYLVGSCTSTGGCDYTKARLSHFTHVAAGGAIKGMALESTKLPLENRVWYTMPGQAFATNAGTYNQPSAVGRVLDDGTTQLYRYSYDTAGLFKLTQVTDPLGRITTFNYANGIDLLSITQATTPSYSPGGSMWTTIAQFVYDYRHRPLAYSDAAGQITLMAYNAKGQMTSLTNPLGETTEYQYDTAHNLTTVINANSATDATYAYDSFARVRTYTDSEGWTVTYDYDAADRVTKVTYPDGSFESYIYDRLDLVAYTDRQYRTWTYVYDANRRLVSVTDPQNQQTQYGYDRDGRLTSLTDPKTNVTTWTYDVQGRLIGKQYPDTSTVTYAYETTTSRLKSVTDALSQVKTYSYAKDDRLTAIAYTGAVNPTPNVGFTWDPYFPRLVSRTDGAGTTQFTYVPVGSLGALQVQQEAGPFANSAITSAYDALGRLSSRTVQGAGAETFQYDAIGRLTGHSSDLGAFTLGYLGQTGQITSRQLASSTLATTWSYLTNIDDRRLAGINNVGLVSGHFSTFAYTTTPENFIGAITETSDATAVYPPAGSQTATYNTLNQLTDLSGQALTYDAVGNLTSDGQRTYAWDAENRLVLITYPGQPGKQTAFTYDGLGRRRTITSTPPAGGSATTTAYVWCKERICQARDGSNVPIRSYYAEGEYVPGTPASLYYGIDQIGSVRRVFASTTSAPAYNYDPNGVPLQATAPVTDFVFGGMFYNADSGLYLTQYRLYDSVAGRWLSRDPLGESTDNVGNLYSYVSGNPVSLTDPDGRMIWPLPRPILPGRTDACPKPPSQPGCPPGMSCMTDDQGSGGGRGDASQTPAPALKGDPYNPAEVDRRRSRLREELGAPSKDPDSPIPDQGPGYNVGGQPAKQGTPHSTGERNVNPSEEHSRRPKGNPSGPRY